MKIENENVILNSKNGGNVVATVSVCRYMQSLTEAERVAAGWGAYSAELLALDLSAVPLLTAAELFPPVL